MRTMHASCIAATGRNYFEILHPSILSEMFRVDLTLETVKAEKMQSDLLDNAISLIQR